MADFPNWKRNIVLFMTGQGLSLFGSSLVHYAILWHITLETQSALMMTFISLAGVLPIFFISPFAGVWADRFNKKHLINISDALIALVTLVIAIIFSIGIDLIGLLLVCLVIRALGQGAQTPAVNAMIPDFVPPEHLTRVNGLNGSIQSLVTFLSPMLGGVLLAIAPIQTLMLIDVFTALIGISILLFFVKIPKKTKATEEKQGAKQYFVKIHEGFGYILKQPFFRKTLTVSTVINFMLAPIIFLIPLHVARYWGDMSWNIFGSISFEAEHRLAAVQVGFSLGMLFGGLVIGAWGGLKNKNKTFSACTMLLGLSAVGLSQFGNFWLFAICMGLTGLFLSMRGAPVISMLQTNADPAYIGRVFAAQSMIGSVSMPLSMMLWGPLGDTVAVKWLILTAGVCIFLLGLVLIFDKVMLKAGEVSKNP